MTLPGEVGTDHAARIASSSSATAASSDKFANPRCWRARCQIARLAYANRVRRVAAGVVGMGSNGDLGRSEVGELRRSVSGTTCSRMRTGTVQPVSACATACWLCNAVEVGGSHESARRHRRVQPRHREAFIKEVIKDAVGSEETEPGCLMFNVTQESDIPRAAPLRGLPRHSGRRHAQEHPPYLAVP